MHIQDILSGSGTSPTMSLEFFPPNTTEATDRLQDTLRDFETLSPSFISITYGAGGGTRTATELLVRQITQQGTHDPIPHLTCVKQSPQDIDEILNLYAQSGVGNILALRGDKPRCSPDHDHLSDSFPFGVDLVKHIRKFNDLKIHPDTRGFGIGVAGFPEGHPSTPNRLLEMDYLKAKIDAGADYICTQLFFDNRDFHDFRERCTLAGIHVPIIAGILPITSMAGLRRMAELAGGARIPARLLKALHQVQNDPDAVKQIGLHHATEQCSELINQSVAGIHFYTLNQSQPVMEILRRLGRV